MRILIVRCVSGVGREERVFERLIVKEIRHFVCLNLSGKPIDDFLRCFFDNKIGSRLDHRIGDREDLSMNQTSDDRDPLSKGADR
jgi:hypothetical protein